MLHEDCHQESLGEYEKVMFVKTGEHTSVIYGTHYPNRLFVGCLPPEAGAEDLGNFFSSFGNVVEAKVVLDHYGRSKRFGFVTFSDPGKVESLIAGENIWFKGKKINVGPAVKKNLEPECAVKPSLKPSAKPFFCTNNNSQHAAKTVIRSCPAEPSHQQPDPILDLSWALNDLSFQSLWGITNQASSIWAPPNEARQQDTCMQEKSFSFLSEMQEYKYHTRCNQSYGNHFPYFPTYQGNMCAPPPGFN